MPLILPYGNKAPHIASSAFIADNATIIGDVEIGEHVSIWFGSVLRADVGIIRIGARSNIQDLCCIHMTNGLSSTIIGEDVTIGHSVLLHGCVVKNRCLIGMGSIVLDNAEIGETSMIGAGSLLTSRVVIPPGHLALGRPAKIIRPLTDQEAQMGLQSAQRYVHYAQQYRTSSLEAQCRA